MKKPAKELKCFAKVYSTPVWMRGTLMCWGGFGQPQCKHLKKCIEQCKKIGIPEVKIKRAVGRLINN